MAFEALDELLDESIRLPLPGRDGTRREYAIPSPPAEDGLLVERIIGEFRQAARENTRPDLEFLNDDEERDLYRLVLGPAYDEMVENGVPWAWLKHASMTAMVWISTGTQAAENYWATKGGRPEPQAPNRATRRASTRKGSSPAAKSTPKRGSQSGTSTPRATARKQPAPAA